MSHYTFRMLALLQNPAWIWNGGWTISRNHSGIMLWVMTQAYAPFCSPLQHAELRCSPGAPTLWTGAYCRSGKWSRQFWGGFCAHSVQNSCIHIKWRNCPCIKRWLINIAYCHSFGKMSYSIDRSARVLLLDSLRIATMQKPSHLHSLLQRAEVSLQGFVFFSREKCDNKEPDANMSWCPV